MPEVSVTKTKEKELTPRTMVDMPLFRGSLFSMNPFALMRQFTDEMDRMFAVWPEAKMEFWTPAVEMKRANGAVTVTAELPGLTKENVKVSVSEQGLTIEGERREEKEEKGEESYRSERSYGKFLRTLPLPDGADLERVTASIENGVLKVTVPCPESKAAKKEVPIQEAPPTKAAA
ncbi:MAG: Hsp20/alpha crystallin family protein [Bryobacterales bacterium]|nr:Hsp20/alpha crystallin family protein [Bryobacterales bacterium]